MTQDQIDAFSDFINEVSESLTEVIDAIHDHMAPDAQRALGETRRRMAVAEREFNQAMKP